MIVMLVMMLAVLAIRVLLRIHITLGFAVPRRDHLAMPIAILLLTEVVVGVAHSDVRLLIIFFDLDIGQRELTYLIVRVADA